jgi:pSer/pThr/pTyr-binding forkhead associated (FHA) protein
MTAKLEKLEAQIQEMIEIRMVSILPGQKIESAVVQQLAGAMHANINEVDGEKIAPSLYTLVTPPNESNLWQDARLLEALRESLYAVGCEAGLEFATPPTLSVSTDPKLAPGQVDEEHIPDNAFIIINGRKVFPLKDRVINIGRRLENQLVIDDPRVSRTHAQLRAIKGRYVLFDLNSTGGTFINGQRTSQTALYPGDVISLAGVTLVFGQDNPPQRLDLKDTGPMNPQIIDRPTAILKERASIRKRKKCAELLC